MALPTSVYSKSSVALGESYELNAFYSNGNCQTQQRLLPKNFLNRNKRLTARILQLRRPSGSLINSDQEMVELLKTTFLGFFRGREDDSHVGIMMVRLISLLLQRQGRILIGIRQFGSTL